MNLPNKITLSRLLLIPVIIFFYLADSFIPAGKLIATIIFAIATFTDFLDGYFARKLNLVTTLGKFLDSIADKMLVLSSLVLLICDGTILAPYGAIATIIILAREFMVSALRQMAASKDIIIAADMWGKVKANFQFFAVMFFMLLSYLLGLNIMSSTLTIVAEVICYSLLAITILATIISGVHYLVKNGEVFVDKKEE